MPTTWQDASWLGSSGTHLKGGKGEKGGKRGNGEEGGWGGKGKGTQATGGDEGGEGGGGGGGGRGGGGRGRKGSGKGKGKVFQQGKKGYVKPETPPTSSEGGGRTHTPEAKRMKGEEWNWEGYENDADMAGQEWDGSYSEGGGQGFGWDGNRDQAGVGQGWSWIGTVLAWSHLAVGCI